MELANRFFKSTQTKRFIGLLIVVVVLYCMRSMIDMILMTFLFSYLFTRSEKLFKSKFNLTKTPLKIAQLSLFVLVIAGIGYVAVRFIPEIITQLTQMTAELVEFYNQPSDSEIVIMLKELLDKLYFQIFSSQGMSYITKVVSDISKWGLNLFLSLMLSLFFTLGRESIIAFTMKFKKSKASLVYEEIEFFGRKFIDSFGKVIEVQIVIALVNGILSTIGLTIIGFPNVIGFGVIIFILGMVPVAGVIISLVPLCIAAYNINGLVSIAYVLVMILILHGIEAYVLNPKLMASKTKLPVFYTLTILIFSEHFFGIWGLIMGIPMFMFLLVLLEVPVGAKES